MKKFTLLLLLAIASLSTSCNNNVYMRATGFALGTTYSIIYNSTDTLQSAIEQLMTDVEASLSIYNPSSIISKVNRNEEVALDSYFIECFNTAKEVSAATNGAFDISASPLFEAWGFGSQKTNRIPGAREIDSLKQFCGMDKVAIVGNRIVKTDPRVQLNANAIAKGYAVDVVSRFIESKEIKSYLVEIGGEIFCRGVNPRGQSWIIGVDRPQDGNNLPGNELQGKVKLSERGLATSGNYRSFYMHNGKKVAHTINPTTGQPTYHNLLSTTILAKNCALADAYATALMVLGLDEAKELLSKHLELEGYLIYSDQEQFSTYATAGLLQLMVE